VDSAGRSVPGPREPTCGRYQCARSDNLVELSPTSRSIPIGPAGAGLGLLVLAVVLRMSGRRRDRADGEGGTG
jgi:hypothetical protein